MGESRAYKSVPGCPNDEAARYSAADMAIGHGALDFIQYGDSDESKAVKGTLLVPLTRDEETTSSLTAIQRIDECAQGRAIWHTFMDSNQHGAALKIQHTPHNYRMYSSEPNCSTTQQAQERCAELAISEGALEYISEHSKKDVARNTAQPWSLQTFFESLPRPLEEDFGNRNAPQIQPVAWLANVHTQFPGSRFSKAYHALSNRAGHGCLLRLKHTPIDGPPTVYSYLFEPQETSAKEAKAAVALLALSLGAGNLIRAASAASQALLSPEIRNFTTRFVFSALASETRRVSGGSPVYEYNTVDDAYGCTLNLNPNLNPDLTYTVPPQYASRTDARIAVGYLAAQQGALDILRCDGKPPPSGYTPAFKFPSGGGVPVPAAPAWARKRKNNSVSGFISTILRHCNQEAGAVVLKA
uniref:Uncharacterized protein n=1 Tax=Mycena chlorophos TaxID=658473 RepID=A0ABQ0LTH0_MYCCL|nr:predicted protein [Mycena chlorophos]